MTMNTNEVLIWLKEFKYTWLPQNILNDNHLIELITHKLYELEQLLSPNNHDESETSIENEHEDPKSNDIEEIVLLEEEPLLPTPPEIPIKKATENKTSYRPAIRLKRIPLEEAANFLPPEWKITKSKRGKKKGKKKLPKSSSYKKKTTQTNKVLLSTSTSNEVENKSNNIRKSTRSKKPTQRSSTISLPDTQLINGDKKKGKRKLRAIDAEDDDLFILGTLSQTENPNGNTDCEQISRYIGQNGILSQTRKTNETTITTFDDDFTIKLPSRQPNQEKALTRNRFSNRSGDVNINPIITEVPIAEVVIPDDDVDPLDDDQMFQDIMENHVDDESLFTSLNIINEASPILNQDSILNYNDCIEDISNDGMDLPPSSSSPNSDHLTLTT